MMDDDFTVTEHARFEWGDTRMRCIDGSGMAHHAADLFVGDVNPMTKRDWLEGSELRGIIVVKVRSSENRK
jgi:hypothetical protein